MTSLWCLRRWLPILCLGAAVDAQSFSTSNGNPNGSWTYGASGTPLPLTANWNANGALPCTVPAWAPSNNAGNIAPAFFLANACVSSFFGPDPNYGAGYPNVAPGTIVIRTSDNSNVRASLLFTAPAPQGTNTASYHLWNAGLNAHPQDWAVLVNGVQVCSGVLSGTVPYSALETCAYPHGLKPGDTVELELFKDLNSSSGDFVGIAADLGGITDYTTTVAEIDTYNTTNVTQEVNAYQVELKARMQGNTYLYDQTFNVPFADSTVQAAITQAKSVLTQTGALSLTGPTQLSSTTSTASATNTVQAVQSNNTYFGTTTYFGPQVIAVGSRGICQTSSVPPASTASSLYPVLTGCTSGTVMNLFAGAEDIDTIITSFVTIGQTVTTTNTTLTSQVYEIDGFISSFSPCDINQDTKTNMVDVQDIVKEALGVSSATDDLNGDGAVSVVETQIVMNAVLNLGCSATGDTSVSSSVPAQTAVRNPGRYTRTLASAASKPPAAPAPLPTIAAVVNAASFRSGPIAPGEIVTLLGTGFGPGGVRVLFDGRAAPLTYASDTQISCVVPLYEVPGRGNIYVQVRHQDQTSIPFSLAVTAANPALFTADGSGSGPAAALNQDGSQNSPTNPAAKGSTVVIFLTGEGQTSPAGVTGKVTTVSAVPLMTPRPVLPVSVLIGGQAASVASYGKVPGVTSGVMQLNARIPSNVPSGNLAISVSVGGNTSPDGVTVSVE